MERRVGVCSFSCQCPGPASLCWPALVWPLFWLLWWWKVLWINSWPDTGLQLWLQRRRGGLPKPSHPLLLGRPGFPPPLHSPPPPPPHPALTPPAKPFINQPVGSQATPDTWHTILAGRPDMVGGGQVWSPAQNYNGSSHAHGPRTHTLNNNTQPPPAPSFFFLTWTLCSKLQLTDDHVLKYFLSHTLSFKPPLSPPMCPTLSDVSKVKTSPALMWYFQT